MCVDITKLDKEGMLLCIRNGNIDEADLLELVGTIQDTEKAVLYYQDAVQGGEKMAIKPLANCYLNGIGVNKDINRYNELMSMIEKG